MSRLRVGALCAGYGGLELALADVLDVELVWYAEKDPAAAKVLALRFPGAPNLGDITEVDWSKVEPVDIATAGFPCQDVSLAGRRAGLAAGTRSGLWLYIADALAVLRPSLVLLENVRGLLSARADGAVEPESACLGDGPDVPVLRALGAVLGDLAELGLDAEWTGLRAADVRAPHGRFRVGILAWPAGAHPAGVGRGAQRWDNRLRAEGLESGGGSEPAPDTQRGERERELQPGRGALGGTAAAGRGPRPAADPGRDTRPEDDQNRPAPRRRGGTPADPDRDAVRLEPVAVTGSGGAALTGLTGGERRPAPDPESDGRNEGRPESAVVLRGSDAAQCCADVAPDADSIGPLRGGPARRRGGGPADDRRAAPADSDGVRLGSDERHLLAREPDAAGGSAGDPSGVGEQDEPLGGAGPVVLQPFAGAEHRDRERDPAEGVQELGRSAPVLAWGPYEPAIRRWELTLGRSAPAPTEPSTKGSQRLSPRFVEWMQGLPEGWVCDVPGLSRNDQLRILGNGVVPQWGSAVLRILLARAFGSESAA